MCMYTGTRGMVQYASHSVWSINIYHAPSIIMTYAQHVLYIFVKEPRPVYIMRHTWDYCYWGECLQRQRCCHDHQTMFTATGHHPPYFHETGYPLHPPSNEVRAWAPWGSTTHIYTTEKRKTRMMHLTFDQCFPCIASYQCSQFL